MDLKSWSAQLKEKDALFVVFDIVLFALPGVAAIFLYAPELFYRLDWVKLLILASAFLAPIYLFNALILSVLERFPKPKEDNLFINFSLSIVLTSLVAYFTLIAGYFLQYSFQALILWMITLEGILFILALIRDYKIWSKNLNSF